MTSMFEALVAAALWYAANGEGQRKAPEWVTCLALFSGAVALRRGESPANAGSVARIFGYAFWGIAWAWVDALSGRWDPARLQAVWLVGDEETRELAAGLCRRAGLPQLVL